MFRNKRALLVLALAVVMVMTLVAPVAMAKTSTPSNTSTSSKALTVALKNAGGKLELATLFWKAAFWFNVVGPQRFGVQYDFPVSVWDLELDQARAQYAIASNPATPPAEALAAANLCFTLSEALKTKIENTIHAGGRSKGEYQTKSHLRVLVFGSDPYVLGAASQWLTNYNIQNDVALDKTLKSYNLSDYDVVVFDPEYSVYGKAAGTGTDIFGPGTEGRYGGLSPEDNAYLQTYLSTGKLGLVYMEPVYISGYFQSTYCEFGQIPFLKVAMDFWGGAWSGEPVNVNVVAPDSPITYGLPPAFTVSTGGQWKRIDIMADPAITNKNVVCTADGFEIIGFNYGKGRVSLTGMDNWGAPNDTNVGKIIRNSVLWSNPN